MTLKFIGLIICLSYLVFAICILTFFMDKCNKDKKRFFHVHLHIYKCYCEFISAISYVCRLWVIRYE